MKSGSGADTFLSVLGRLSTGSLAAQEPIWVLGSEDAKRMAGVLKEAGHNADHEDYQDTENQVASRAEAAMGILDPSKPGMVIFFIDGFGMKISKFYDHWDAKVARFKDFDREGATWKGQLAMTAVLCEIESDDSGKKSSLTKILAKAQIRLHILEGENPKAVGDMDASIKQMAEIIHNVLVQSYKDPEADASTPIARRIVPVGNAVAAKITDFMIDEGCTVGFHYLEAKDVGLASLTRLGNEIMHADDNSVAVFLINNNAVIIAKVGEFWELQVIMFSDPDPIDMTWARITVGAKRQVSVDAESSDGLTSFGRVVGMGLAGCIHKATN